MLQTGFKWCYLLSQPGKACFKDLQDLCESKRCWLVIIWVIISPDTQMHTIMITADTSPSIIAWSHLSWCRVVHLSRLCRQTSALSAGQRSLNYWIQHNPSLCGCSCRVLLPGTALNVMSLLARVTLIHRVASTVWCDVTSAMSKLPQKSAK